MNNVNDQIDFNFSRPLDIQKNLDLKKAKSLLENIVSLKGKNILLEKHLKLLLIIHCNSIQSQIKKKKK